MLRRIRNSVLVASVFAVSAFMFYLLIEFIKFPDESVKFEKDSKF